MKRIVLVAIVWILWMSVPALALIFLSGVTLESMLIKSEIIVIGTVTDFSAEANTATIRVEEAVKGQAAGDLKVTGAMVRVTATTKKPRFAVKDRVVVFCGPAADGTRALLDAQTLAGDAEVATMKGCIAEITPVAQQLVDLGDIKKPINEPALQKTFATMVVSKNSYTKIVAGRLMSTRLADAVKPDLWTDIIVTALKSNRLELVKGAIAMAGKYETLPPAVKEAVAALAAPTAHEQIRADKDVQAYVKKVAGG